MWTLTIGLLEKVDLNSRLTNFEIWLISSSSKISGTQERFSIKSSIFKDISIKTLSTILLSETPIWEIWGVITRYPFLSITIEIVTNQFHKECHLVINHSLLISII